MKKSFNLKNYVKKIAFYDDDRGYWVAQTRAWMNCYKQQSDKKKGPQDAWNTCMEEYQNTDDKGKWVLAYSGAKDDVSKPALDAKTPAAQKIK